MDAIMQHSVQKHVFSKNIKVSMDNNKSVMDGIIIKTRIIYFNSSILLSHAVTPIDFRDTRYHTLCSVYNLQIHQRPQRIMTVHV